MTALEILRPTLERGCCIAHPELLAVIVLGPPEKIAHDELQLACRIHRVLARGLLVVI